MPTPEARALAEEVFYMDTPEEVALALDRFAAQRGAEPVAARTITIEFDDIDVANRVFEAIEIIMEDADPEQDGTLSISSPSAPPQTGSGDALPKPTYAPGREPCGECHLRPGEVCDICGAIMSDQLTGRPLEQVLYEFLRASDFSYQAFFSALKRFAAQSPQTGGGDAPDMSMEAVKARLATYQPLGSHARGVAGPAIAPDELSERDGADPTHAGGGDAGERARVAVEALPSRLFDRKHTEEIALNLTPEFEAALRSSHREGVEACADILERRARGFASGGHVDAIFSGRIVADELNANARKFRALPIPGSKTDAG